MTVTVYKLSSRIHSHIIGKYISRGHRGKLWRRLYDFDIDYGYFGKCLKQSIENSDASSIPSSWFLEHFDQQWISNANAITTLFFFFSFFFNRKRPFLLSRINIPMLKKRMLGFSKRWVVEFMVTQTRVATRNSVIISYSCVSRIV